ISATVTACQDGGFGWGKGTLFAGGFSAEGFSDGAASAAGLFLGAVARGFEVPGAPVVPPLAAFFSASLNVSTGGIAERSCVDADGDEGAGTDGCGGGQVGGVVGAGGSSDDRAAAGVYPRDSARIPTTTHDIKATLTQALPERRAKRCCASPRNIFA